LKIDVVLPSKGEWTLRYCLGSLRKNVSINKLILVRPSIVNSPNASWKGLESIPNEVIFFDQKNIGAARAMGLKSVETEYCASIDSDVIVNKKWFEWCSKTIQQERIGACQGYARAVAKIFTPMNIAAIKSAGGTKFSCLGNTMLNTEIAKKVGIPEVPYGEDWRFRSKMERMGYKWISNLDIQCQHLKTDIDVWKHFIWWGKVDGVTTIPMILRHLGWYATVGMLEEPLEYNLFSIAKELFLLYGKLSRQKATLLSFLKENRSMKEKTSKGDY
jgi:hypothetical protein